MNISEIDNPRFVIWMIKNNLTEVPKDSVNLNEYMCWINTNASKYKKDKGINHIIDHDDFTEYLKGV